MALKSKPFEIRVTGSYSLLLLPMEVIQPFLDKNIKRVKVKAAFEGKELEFHGALPKTKWKLSHDVWKTLPKGTRCFS